MKQGPSVVLELVGKLECSTQTARTQGIPSAKRTLLASRGGGIEDSADYLGNPHPSLRLPAGGTQAAAIEVSDLPTLLRHRSKQTNVQPAPSVGMQSEGDLLEEFAFIPPIFLASLLSYYQDALSLQRLHVFP